MNWSSIQPYIERFRTDRLVEQLHAWNIDGLSSNRWFLAVFAIAIVVTYLIKWRAISALLVGIGGFLLALSWAIGKGTGVEGIEAGGIWILVGGGAIVVALFIYILFIKTD